MSIQQLAGPTVNRAAGAYLGARDPVLAAVIAASGPCTLQQHHEYYQALAGSIIGQQLSVKAAASIKQRFEDMFGGAFPGPDAVLTKTPEELRAAGLSTAKTLYLLDLARRVHNGDIRLDTFDAIDNSAIIDELTAIKGIGTWTAHMFLMFCMGRLDVLPTGDLGIRSGIRKLYGLVDMPTPQQVTELAHERQWHPYESIASWYIWRSLDNAPA